MAGVSSLGQVSQDQLLQLLVTQLQNQDPLSPTNSDQMLAEIAQLNTASGIASLNASFSQMLKMQTLTQGADLIGKTVQYKAPDGGAPTTGKVTQVTADNGNFVLQVGSDKVSLDSILSVK